MDPDPSNSNMRKQRYFDKEKRQLSIILIVAWTMFSLIQGKRGSTGGIRRLRLRHGGIQ
jgi:hypothetical protein